MAGDGPKLNPAALPLADAARLLSGAGGQAVTVAMFGADVAAGAPLNADGTLNLVHYAAWLMREAGSRRPEAADAGPQTRSSDIGSRLQTPDSGLPHGA